MKCLFVRHKYVFILSLKNMNCVTFVIMINVDNII